MRWETSKWLLLSHLQYGMRANLCGNDFWSLNKNFFKWDGWGVAHSKCPDHMPIVLLSGKLHFVLECIGIVVEYFNTIFCEQKTGFGTILNSKLATNTKQVFTYICARQTKSVKIPSWGNYPPTLTTSKETSISQRRNIKKVSIESWNNKLSNDI